MSYTDGTSSVFPASLKLLDFEIKIVGAITDVARLAEAPPHGQTAYKTTNKLEVELREIGNSATGLPDRVMHITLPDGTNPGKFSNKLLDAVRRAQPKEGFEIIDALQHAIGIASAQIFDGKQPEMKILPFTPGPRRAI